MLNVDWATLKAFALARSLSLQYVALQSTYFIWAIDGPMYLSVQIPITSPASADQTDFENNFQAAANRSPRTSTNARGVGSFQYIYGAIAGGLAFADICSITLANGKTYEDISMLSASSQPANIQLVWRQGGVDHVVYDVVLTSGQQSFQSFAPSFRLAIPSDSNTYTLVAKGKNLSVLGPMSATISGVQL